MSGSDGERAAQAPGQLRVRGEHRCFGGVQGLYEADSAACGGPMRFSLFLPPQARRGAPVPVLYYLAGLTCSEEHLPTKGCGQRWAAELGLALASCDTSPRHARFAGDDAAWDFGIGAGFYVDALVEPWAGTYAMETHVARELPAWIEAHFPVRGDRRGIFGHSMGGHGALALAQRHPGRWMSVSALAPIVAPSEVPWGHKAFSGYLGEDRRDLWLEHDACALLRARGPTDSPWLVDQGLADSFLATQLRPERLEAAATQAGQALRVRRHEGYDHGYYFVATFMEDHVRHHAARLLA